MSTTVINGKRYWRARAGDMLDEIALEIYGEGATEHLIAVNAQAAASPVLPAGTLVLLPEFTQPETTRVRRLFE